MSKRILFAILCIIILATPILTVDASDNSLYLIRIYTSSLDDIPIGFDIVGYKPNSWVDIIIPSYNLNLIDGLNYSIILDDVVAYDNSIRDGYHSFDEMELELKEIASSYPNITMLTSIGRSWEGRDIWCLEVSDNPGVDEDESGILFMGLHHAREWPSMEVCLYLVEEFTSQYGLNSTITNLVDNRRIWIIPCVNPDGYVFSHDQGHDWRKNRRFFSEYNAYGVDINRNYAGSCNGIAVGMWGSGGVISHNPYSETYCGPSPFSEFETQAIKNFVLTHCICASISYHTYSELVLWPWGYSYTDKTPDDVLLKKIGEDIAYNITRQDGSGFYTPTQSSKLYTTTGDSDDWLYGYSFYVLGRICFPYTIELCSSFHPSYRALQQVFKENLDGAIVLLRKAEEIQSITPMVRPPTITNVTYISPGSYILSWKLGNPGVDVKYFQLEELEGYSGLYDNADAGNLWFFDGFDRCSSKYHSRDYSYHFSSSNVYGYMSSIYPLPVNGSMNLSFWCLYNLEKDRNYGFVEVSRDGRNYEILDSFTGSSNGWIYKNYSLDSYRGSSLYIRFRVIKSVSGNNDFFIDDIYPVPFFSSINVISSNITDYSYKLYNKSNGVYYYRVRGYNDERGWGDYSCIKSVRYRIDNPPYLKIHGPRIGLVGDNISYTFNVVDIDNDNIFLYIDWGDGSNSVWIGPYSSNEDIRYSHIWNKSGLYILKAIVKDEYGLESNWYRYPVFISKIGFFMLQPNLKK
ncbi:MAG: hypothetical protein DRN12_05775 [Thermoplasmata archaeon]|nr:MAG: hypothetical protein DRN12_05775 [Thermoplasmata archaeon]